MNAMLFIDKCREVLPPQKDLNAGQWAAYREKLGRFSESQLDRLYDAVLENCKRFPAIADVYEQARTLGFMNRKDRKPHVWKPTACELCEGSGLIAAFWSQEFEICEGAKTQILRLHYLYPYHRSGGYGIRGDHTDIRTVYRCLCPGGEVETLDKGIPRWSADAPQVRRREWAS